MKVAFKDDSFAFEFVRNLGFMYYGGADLGEMIATAQQITEGDFASWFVEWDKRARRILARADADLGESHLESARQGYLRASTYFRMAEFYLHGDPADPRILPESRASQEAYAKGAKLTGRTWEPAQIPFEGTTLPGYFYKVDESGKPRPTLIFHGGLVPASKSFSISAQQGPWHAVTTVLPSTVPVRVLRCASRSSTTASTGKRW